MPLLIARAVLLDMDGTLVNSDAAVERTWHRWAARYRLDGAYVYGISHGRQAQETMAELLPGRSREKNLAEARELVEAEAADLDGVTEIPGAARFLAALAGVPHALVTSAPDALARTRMAAVGLPLPPVMVTADRVSASKPDPEGFLKAAAELGVDPADCIAFEDSAAGIAAATAGRIRVIGVGPRAQPHRADLHIDDFTELRMESIGAAQIQLSADGASVP